MDATTKKQTVKKYYDEIWSKGRLALIDDLMTDDYENCDPATPGAVLKGREASKAIFPARLQRVRDGGRELFAQIRDGFENASRDHHRAGVSRGLVSTFREAMPDLVMAIAVWALENDLL